MKFLSKIVKQLSELNNFNKFNLMKYSNFGLNKTLC